MLLNIGGKLPGKSNVSKSDNHSNNASKCLTHQNMTFCYWSTIGKWFSSSCIFCLPSNIRLGFNRSSRSRCSAFHLPGNRIWSFTQRSRIGSSWCHHQIPTNKLALASVKPSSDSLGYSMKYNAIGICKTSRNCFIKIFY